MDFKFTPEQEAFRKEVREFLVRELPQEDPKVLAKGIDGFSHKFSKKVAAKGWIGMAWPKQYGGKEIDYISRAIFTEEMVYAGAPSCFHWAGDRQIGPAIIAHGTEEQKKDLLPKIVNADISILIGYSEPGAGSDLASLKTRAVEEGDYFVINGHKTWFSSAQYANYGWVAVRTDPSVSKHKGITELLVDMKLPGITIRPIEDMVGGNSLCEVFFKDVKVPKSMLMGKKNEGWKQMTTELAYERSGIDRLMNNRRLFEAIVKYVHEKEQHEKSERWVLLRYKLAELEMEYQVGRLFAYRVAAMLQQGRTPVYEASFSKVYGSELEQRVANVAMEILGLYGELRKDTQYSQLSSWVSRAYLRNIGYTFQGGTSEIQRNVIATRGLGLGTSK